MSCTDGDCPNTRPTPTKGDCSAAGRSKTEGFRFPMPLGVELPLPESPGIRKGRDGECFSYCSNIFSNREKNSSLIGCIYTEK